MHKYYILDRNHQPVATDMMTWGRWFEDDANRRVAHSETEFHWISTVCLGLDHNFFGKGPPILFETMVFERQEHITKVFGKERFVHEEMDCVRYATWDEAKAGHAAMVMQVIRNEQQATAALNKWMTREKADPKS
jgi:hypothetical protein